MSSWKYWSFSFPVSAVFMRRQEGTSAKWVGSRGSVSLRSDILESVNFVGYAEWLIGEGWRFVGDDSADHRPFL